MFIFRSPFVKVYYLFIFFFFFSSRRRHTRLVSDWSSDVCSSDLASFESLGMDLGFSETEAQEKALQVLINIQGSLVVSKAVGNLAPFKQALKNILEMYQSSGNS